MANEKNLQPLDKKCKEEAKKIRSMGGIARGEKIRKRKTFAELAKAMLDSKVTKEQLGVMKQVFPELDVEEVTNRTLMIQKQMDKAVIEGDTKAFEVLRDTIGEKPKDTVQHIGDIPKVEPVKASQEDLAKKRAEMNQDLEK